MRILVHRYTDVNTHKDEIIHGLKILITLLEDRFSEYILYASTSFCETLTDTSMNIGRFLMRKENGEIFSFRVPCPNQLLYMYTDSYYGCNILHIDTVMPELNELCEIVVTACQPFRGAIRLKHYNPYDVDLDNNTIAKVDNANENL